MSIKNKRSKALADKKSAAYCPESPNGKHKAAWEMVEVTRSDVSVCVRCKLCKRYGSIGKIPPEAVTWDQ